MRFDYLVESRNPKLNDLLATQTLLNILGGGLLSTAAALVFVGSPLVAKYQRPALPVIFLGAGLAASASIACGLRLRRVEEEVRVEQMTDSLDADDAIANQIFYRQTRRQHTTEHAIAIADPRPKPELEPEQESLPAPEQMQVEDDYSKLASKISKRLARHGCFLQYEGGTAGFSTISLKFRPLNDTKAKAVEGLISEVQLAAKANVPPVFTLRDGLIELELPRKDKDREIAYWQDFLTPADAPHSEPVKMLIGADISRKLVFANLSEDSNIVHFLVAGTTGSGKTAFIQSAIASLILRYPRERLQIAIIDPKCVDFSGWTWQNLEHLYRPIINDICEAIDFLEELAAEMERRYEFILKPARAKNIEEFNHANKQQILPRIITLIDEIREFTEVGEKEEIKRFENAVARLGGKARAAGIHLICSTQYPIAKVLPTKIKANLGTRIGLLTATNVESQVIIDASGCENLLGAGDMLYRATGKIQRLQSLYLEEEVFAEMAIELGVSCGVSPVLAGVSSAINTGSNTANTLTQQRCQVNTAQRYFPSQLPLDPFCEVTPELAKFVQACLNDGKNQTEIIKLVWGVSKGTSAKYHFAKQRYDEAIAMLQSPSANYHIDLTNLVKVALTDCRLLPVRSGVYFVVDSEFNCYYIGSSKNLMMRWQYEGQPHHRMAQFEQINEDTPLYILSYPCENYEDEEERAIAHFKPTLNGTRVEG